MHINLCIGLAKRGGKQLQFNACDPEALPKPKFSHIEAIFCLWKGKYAHAEHTALSPFTSNSNYSTSPVHHDQSWIPSSGGVLLFCNQTEWVPQCRALSQQLRQTCTITAFSSTSRISHSCFTVGGLVQPELSRGMDFSVKQAARSKHKHTQHLKRVHGGRGRGRGGSGSAARTGPELDSNYDRCVLPRCKQGIPSAQYHSLHLEFNSKQ